MAGPMARETLTPTRSSREAAPKLRPRYQLGDVRRPGGQLNRRPDTKQERESDQQGGRHLSERGQHREHDAKDEEVCLDREQQPTPIEGVRQHPTGQREQHDRQCRCRLYQRDEDGGVGRVHQQPLRADGLHPGAGPADQHPDPKPPKRALTQRARNPRVQRGRILGQAAASGGVVAWLRHAADARASDSGVGAPGRTRVSGFNGPAANCLTNWLTMTSPEAGQDRTVPHSRSA